MHCVCSTACSELRGCRAKPAKINTEYLPCVSSSFNMSTQKLQPPRNKMWWNGQIRTCGGTWNVESVMSMSKSFWVREVKAHVHEVGYVGSQDYRAFLWIESVNTWGGHGHRFHIRIISAHGRIACQLVLHLTCWEELKWSHAAPTIWRNTRLTLRSLEDELIEKNIILSTPFFPQENTFQMQGNEMS